jgi:hypothetical protein
MQYLIHGTQKRARIIEIELKKDLIHGFRRSIRGVFVLLKKLKNILTHPYVGFEF